MLKKYLRKQDTPGAWIIVFSATLFFFFESILVNLFGTLSKDMMNAFHIDAFGLGKLSASYLFANILLLFPAGILLDRFSIKKILLLAVLTSATASAFLYHTSNIHLAMICVFVSGLGGTFCFLGTMKLASRWFTPKKLALVTGFVVMSAMLGGFVAQTPVAYLAEHAGWRSAFLVLSSFEFLLFIWLSLSLENWPIERPHSSGESIQHLKHSIKIALSTPLNWLCGFFTSALNLPVTLLGAIWGVPLLMQAHGFDRVTASSINSMIFLGMMIGSPLSGWVSDRCRSRLLPMTIGSILSLLLILFLIFAPTQTATAYSLLFLLLGFFSSIQILGYTVIVENTAQEFIGASMGIAAILVMSGGTFLQPLFGRAMKFYWQGHLQNGAPIYSAHAYEVSMLMIPAAFLLALAALIALKRYAKRPGLTH